MHVAEIYLKESKEMLNTLRPEQNGCHFADNILKCILLTENGCVFIQFIPQGSIDSNSVLN